MNRGVPALVLCGLLGVLVQRAAENGKAPTAAEQLDRHRNLGKAFYENPTTQLMAVDEFKKALDLAPDSARERLNYGLALLRAGKTEEGTAELLKAQKQDPSIPHSWFNLGIVYKKESQYEKAAAQFEQMVKLVPDEPVTHYNLGFLYKLLGRGAEAQKEFETSARLNPNLAGPRFQLFNAYKLAGRTEDAAREEKIFYALKKKKAGAAVPEDLDWSFYAEIMDPTDAAKSAEDQSIPPVKLTPKALGKGFSSLLATDLDADGRADLLAWSADGIAIVQGPKLTGLDAAKQIVDLSAADIDNDGLPDLCAIAKSGPILLANRKTQFEPIAANLPQGEFRSALWVDYDHDYDLDLFLLGAKPLLLRNNGKAGFSDETAAFPFVAGTANRGVLFDLVPDTDGFDIVVAYDDRPGVLYRDRFGGTYEPQDLPDLPKGVQHLLARDFNNDGATDLAAGSLLLRNAGAKLTAHGNGSPMAPAAFTDFDNRGLQDLALEGAVHRNLGDGKFEKAEAKIPSPRSITTGDFDADGDEDIALVTSSGEAMLLLNEAGARSWLRTRLTGVKNMKLAVGAKVEVKAGSRYQKLTYHGLPLHFGMRSAAEADTVRITWANGLVQNELKKPTGKELAAKEAPRLSGSCPMIFTWNGSGFEFITDVLAVAPLGASSGDGTYFPVDHDEYVQIPAVAIAPRNGMYEVRITEELREVSYLDQVKLVAVDHPEGETLYTNDKFKSPPFPEFRLFGIRNRIQPVAAKDHRGADVLAAVLRRDATYADTFRRDHSGIAERHSITLDFGAAAARDNRAALVLSGWVDWADGSTFRAAGQESASGLTMPYLQVRDARGEWKTVIEDMGIPAGKPKSIVVDLSGKFLSASREVRIVTDLCVYWDEIFLSEDTAAPQARIAAAIPRNADLAYRGFSRVVVHPERKQPERFVYGPAILPASSWNPTPGFYTRFGDVNPLLAQIDDEMVIVGAGDELTLHFDASAFPPLAAGHKRDFLLFVDGWAKDSDANTAFGRSVEPLPFHGMSAYPYGAAERFPDDERHKRYRETYNTRPALRLLTRMRPEQRTN